MKKICIFILTILAVLNIQFSAFAGIDDTNNKIFAVTPDKMLGHTTFANYEDSTFFPVMTNLVNQGVGLTHFTNGDLVSGSYSSNEIICEASDTFYLYNYNGTNKPAFYNVASGTIDIISSWPYTSFNKYMLVTNGLYGGAIKTFLISSRGIAIHDFSTKAFSSIVTPALWTQPPHTFTVWKSRLFAAGEYNEVYYSRAGDFTNFNVSSYEGGRFDIHPVSNIRKLLAVNNGVYIFTSNGVYYLSGTTPTSWRLDKVSELKYLASKISTYDHDNATLIDNNTVVFIDALHDIYTISNGYNVVKIASAPETGLWANYVVPRGVYLFQNKYLVVTGFTKDTYKKCSHAYDLEKKCWYQWDSIITASTNYYVASYRQDIAANRYFVFNKNINDNNYDDQLTPCYFNDGSSIKNYYQIIFTTPYYTLDGSSRNYKRLKRIEIDCKPYKQKESAYYDSAILNTSSVNLLNVRLDTDRQSNKQREFSITTDAPYAWINLTANDTTYTMRFPELNEFRKIKLTFETTGGILIKQIRFYYQPAGEK